MNKKKLMRQLNKNQNNMSVQTKLLQQINKIESEFQSVAFKIINLLNYIKDDQKNSIKLPPTKFLFECNMQNLTQLLTQLRLSVKCGFVAYSPHI